VRYFCRTALVDLPEDAEAALEFWMNDGSGKTRLTDSSPRGKWNLLMNGRILWFKLPPEWEQPQAEFEKNKLTPSKTKNKSKTQPILSGEQITAARKGLQLSQREVAQKTGKSQSWIRDIENDRFRAKAEDQMLLRRVLGLV